MHLAEQIEKNRQEAEKLDPELVAAFERELAAFYARLDARNEALPNEFLKAIFSNVEALYE